MPLSAGSWARINYYPGFFFFPLATQTTYVKRNSLITTTIEGPQFEMPFIHASCWRFFCCCFFFLSKTIPPVDQEQEEPRRLSQAARFSFRSFSATPEPHCSNIHALRCGVIMLPSGIPSTSSSGVQQLELWTNGTLQVTPDSPRSADRAFPP